MNGEGLTTEDRRVVATLSILCYLAALTCLGAACIGLAPLWLIGVASWGGLAYTFYKQSTVDS
jgi:hypothetical protein